MVETKILELRDKATFIPILCTRVGARASGNSQENYLLRRAGFGGDDIIQLTSFNRAQSQHDQYEWGDRTYTVAHDYIEKNWDTIEPGQVIDVEFILGETTKPKVSEKE